jgi:hypothetical protein
MDIPFRPAPPNSQRAIYVAAVSAIVTLTLTAANAFLFWNGDAGTLLAFPLTFLDGCAVVVAFDALINGDLPLGARLIPAAICIATAVVLVFVPFSQLALDWNFAIHKMQREAAVRTILADGKDDVVPFDGKGAVLSEEGLYPANRAVVSACGTVKCVLFFTHQGTKFQPAEGFLFVPAGGDLSRFYWYGRFRARRIDEHWFFLQEA